LAALGDELLFEEEETPSYLQEQELPLDSLPTTSGLEDPKELKEGKELGSYAICVLSFVFNCQYTDTKFRSQRTHKSNMRPSFYCTTRRNYKISKTLLSD
jgi:hypothetical protein